MKASQKLPKEGPKIAGFAYIFANCWTTAGALGPGPLTEEEG
jgi:hypothetical protein